MNAVKLKESLATGVAVSSMNDEERKTLIKRVLTYGIVMRSQNRLDDTTFETVVNGLNDFLKEEFPNLRDKELDYVVRLGISGELGSNMETFVCGASLMRWVRMYYRHPERLAQIEAIRAEQRQKQHEEQKETDEERNARACNESVHQVFEYYRKYNTIFGEREDMKGIKLPTWAGQIYDYYKTAGHIPEPTEVEARVAHARAERAMERGTIDGKKLTVKATIEDWKKAYLLEQYFANVLKRQIEV